MTAGCTACNDLHPSCGGVVDVSLFQRTLALSIRLLCSLHFRSAQNRSAKLSVCTHGPYNGNISTFPSYEIILLSNEFAWIVTFPSNPLSLLGFAFASKVFTRIKIGLRYPITSSGMVEKDGVWKWGLRGHASGSATRLFENDDGAFFSFFFLFLRGSAVDRQLFGFRSTGTVSAINYSSRLAAFMHTGLTLCHCKCNATHTLRSYVNRVKKKERGTLSCWNTW